MAPHRNPPARPIPRLTSITRPGLDKLRVDEITTLLSDGGVTVPAATKPKLVQLLLDNEEVCIPAAIRPRSAPKTSTADASILTRLTDMETQLKLVYPSLDALEAAATPNKPDDQVPPKPTVPKSKLPRTPVLSVPLRHWRRTPRGNEPAGICSRCGRRGHMRRQCHARHSVGKIKIAKAGSSQRHYRLTNIEAKIPATTDRVAQAEGKIDKITGAGHNRRAVSEPPEPSPAKRAPASKLPRPIHKVFAPRKENIVAPVDPKAICTKCNKVGHLLRTCRA
ncbi:uncharacterized protein EHS24_007576 [Apiotrichum porosum]|uniref:CCHC-type domain-containing protein n=1 Tax=Apiotrichum porosum TaxID=105984 RepID=A0A427XUT0_9TREE|nr:uncharacterized protein EHS24_007576 [Apiotrichum porosum]RSH82592.1 hypothetical protein EHS24_007576 [Apiotrichum porosum]